MIDSPYYPAGAQHDIKAPYNEPKLDVEYYSFWVEFFTSETDDRLKDKWKVTVKVTQTDDHNYVNLIHLPRKAREHPFWEEDLTNAIKQWVRDNVNNNRVIIDLY